MDNTGGDPGKPLVILIATGMQPYREYLLQGISSRFRVHLFHTGEPTWERRYLASWTVVSSTLDGPAMAQRAVNLQQAHRVSGVLCWDEGRILAAAEVASVLGLPGGDPDVVWRIRDKAQTRAALTVAGLPQPRSIPVRTQQQALDAAELIGYPVILKPRGLGASLGVVRADSTEQLRERFGFTRDTQAPDPVRYRTDHPILVEELVSGEEISLDSVIQDGVVTPLFVARKVVGYPPYAEEIGHYVCANDPLLADPGFRRLVQATHTALGLTDGFTHSEFMLSPTGPQVIEVNGRLGGDLIPYLGMLATGIEPGAVAASAACGLNLPLRPDRRKVAGVRFSYVAEDDTTIGTIGFDARALPAGVDQAVVLVRPGAVVSPPPKGTVWGRIAYTTVVADSIAECRDLLDDAALALGYQAQ